MAVTSRSAPRYLPTLTEVVRAAPPPIRVAASQASVQPAQVQEISAEGVRDRVDTILGQRLHEAVATVLLEQVDAISARLMEQIQPLVRQVVADVVAVEMAANRRS